jgi:hypothetical protein
MFDTVLDWPFLGKYALYHNLVKKVRTCWLISVDENLKSHPKKLWKYVSKFRKEDAYLIQLDISGVLFTKTR